MRRYISRKQPIGVTGRARVLSIAIVTGLYLMELGVFARTGLSGVAILMLSPPT